MCLDSWWELQMPLNGAEYSNLYSVKFAGNEEFTTPLAFIVIWDCDCQSSLLTDRRALAAFGGGFVPCGLLPPGPLVSFWSFKWLQRSCVASPHWFYVWLPRKHIQQRKGSILNVLFSPPKWLLKRNVFLLGI